jgi:hypothetical protein
MPVAPSPAKAIIGNELLIPMMSKLSCPSVSFVKVDMMTAAPLGDDVPIPKDFVLLSQNNPASPPKELELLNCTYPVDPPGATLAAATVWFGHAPVTVILAPALIDPEVAERLETITVAGRLPAATFAAGIVILE